MSFKKKTSDLVKVGRSVVQHSMSRIVAQTHRGLLIILYLGVLSFLIITGDNYIYPLDNVP